MTTQQVRNKWNTITIRVKCPEGTAWIQILERKNGEIHKIFMNIGKAGSSVNAQCYVISELVSKLFQLGLGINEVISLLSGITSDRPPVKNEGGIEVRSISEALVVALMRYRTTIIPEDDSGNSKTARFVVR